MNMSLFCTLVFLILTINLTHNVQAAKFIRNAQSHTCLDLTSTSSCAPAILSSCPIDRFSNFSDSLKWDLIPVNPSEVIIRSNNNQLCLSFTSNGTEVCPCDNGVSQRWTLNNNDVISSSVNGECLSLIGNQISVEKCQPGVNAMSWKVYNVAPNTVNLYTKTNFADKPIRLLVNNTYNSNSLPTEIFSSPFSLEVPPGFELVIDRGINNVETVDNDVAQMPPISLLNTILLVRLKPGVIIYEHPDYFGASEFNQVDVKIPSIPFPIGSVLVPQGYRGVIWTNSNFTGDNLGLFEPIANFTGVPLAASLDISANTCKFECGSGGICSNNGTCSCKLGFTGEKCEQCSSGFFGPNCQQCNCTGNKGTCDDEMTGTGECKCNRGFIGVNCDTCAPGFLGTNCIECKCGNGICNEQGGGCSCNAGFDLDPNTNQCTQCKSGYYMSGTDCKSCPPGCNTCDQTGKCTACRQGLTLTNDKCVPKGSCVIGQFFDDGTSSCLPCDNSCKTCFGQGSEQCLECNPPGYYLEGICVLPNNTTIPDGRCSPTIVNQAFFIDTNQKICDACPSSCSDCFIPNFNDSSPVGNMQCSQCMPGFFLDLDNKCVKNCGERKFANNSVCQVCDQSCASCSGPGANQCISCLNENLFSSNGTCSPTQCSSGFVAVNTVCTKCHTDCSECSSPGINQCTKCPPNRPILQDGQCIEVCPMGTYKDGNNTCQKCNTECSTCMGPGADQCLGCNDQNKILLDGVCSGSCPAGSELDKFERICQNLDSGVLPPGEDNNNINSNQENQEKPKKSFRLEWWHILLIVIGSLLLLIAIILLIRYINIKKRKKKTKEFGDQVDENMVAQNLKNMLRATRGIPTQPEMSYSPRSSKEFEDPTSTPPAYNHKDGESYWKKRQQVRKKHVSITPEDYSNWKVARNNKDWDGFDIVTQENFNKAEYSGNPSGSRNDYRNSKGSISSKRSYTIPLGWDGNYEKYDWV